ncbi:hypothetical protein CC80DRAFT_417156 [Byssothecium circinans]|uniref:Uncharacterized protein n=1 Tax=Byssothecium circinans TaxID=147558 RepID=A0A6A5TPE0_9PLEO|nr:hypothetical protein CC80DRAFT_417156 [Byssothecium circinans]
MPLKTSATAVEARAEAGHGFIHWGRFYHLTKEEARRLVQEHPNSTWASVPADERLKIQARVNVKLADEGVPIVSEDVLHWRMSLVVRDVRKWAGMISACYLALVLLLTYMRSTTTCRWRGNEPGIN